MLPLIVIGACLFGFGTYQSMKPEEREVNTGFVAPAVSAPPVSASPGNPRTMQAPDAPPVIPDGATVAAREGETTKVEASINGTQVKVALSHAPWLQAIMTGMSGNFREGIVKSLKAEQIKGSINCAPSLNDLAQASIASLDKVTCTAKDGATIDADFNDDGQGNLSVEYPNGGKVEISKDGEDFRVETRDSR